MISHAAEVPFRPLKAKLTTPERAPEHVPRSALLEEADSALKRRLIVLRAPAGFGKTTLLAEVSRKQREQGTVVGWISVDEDDVPGVLGTSMAAAFEYAGLDLTLLSELDGWSSSPVAHQMGVLARAVELHEAPCLLVLDEVDRLPESSVELLDRLVRWGPANLHLLIAFRSNPGLDLGELVLNGAAHVITTERLRFSRSEIALFFRGELSRRELTAVHERTAGWPIALMLCRNERAGGQGSEPDSESLGSNFVAMRLLPGLPRESRAVLLDLAVFDRIEADLVEAVLGASDSRLRAVNRPALDGLFLRIDKTGAVRRLHPLVKEHCGGLLAVEQPARKRSLHKRIARALARRGHLTAAWRHASLAGDGKLVGELIERAGVLEMFLRDGMVRLLAADRFLTPEITTAFPRCALLRCMALRVALRFKEADALYRSVEQATDGFKRDRDGGDVEALAVDRAFTAGVLAGGSGASSDTRAETMLDGGA